MCGADPDLTNVKTPTERKRPSIVGTPVRSALAPRGASRRKYLRTVGQGHNLSFDVAITGLTSLVTLVTLVIVGCGGNPDGAPNIPDGATNNPDTGNKPAAPGAGIVGLSMDGTRVCFPLCADASTDPDSNGINDGFGYEKQMSCVVPGSIQARSRLMCVIGAPLPTTVGPPPGSAGVVVDTTCFPLCVAVTVDDNGDGYGFEFEAACVFPVSTVAKMSLPCKTGAAVPVRDLSGLPGRLLNEACTPYCATASADPDGDGFGFEFGAGCIVMGSIPATTGIDCKVGDDVLKPTVVLNQNPPAGAVRKPTGIASTGFFVANGKLYDKFGNPFVIRGVNNPHIWFDAANQYLAYQALDPIAKDGANTIRIVWTTSGSPSNLARVIRRVVELHMIPMIELHDVTGGATNDGLLQMAAFYTRSDVKAVLLAYENFLLVNIANEWSGVDFRNAYQMAVSQLRAAGINHTLVIDSNAFGQNSETIFNDGPALLTADPQHNLLFSLHMYQDYSTSAAGQLHITTALGQAVSMGLPLIVGEFGWQLGGVTVDFHLIMSECVRLNLGYISWSWKGNDANLAYLDMAVDWQGQTLTTWGSDVIRGPNGISTTAHAASIFSP